MRFCLLVFFVMTCSFAQAQVKIAQSESPDKKYYLTIQAADNDYESGSGSLQIREKSAKVVGSFDWTQYLPHIDQDSVRVLWKEDSRALAVTWDEVRGLESSTIYALSGKDWVALEFPDFPLKYEEKDGWQSHAEGHFTASAWLPNNILKMDYEEDCFKAKPDGSSDSATNSEWVSFQLIDQAGKPTLQTRGVAEKPPDP